MPFVYDYSKAELSGDVSDMVLHVDQFQYLAPPDFDGAVEPVRFSLPTLRERIKPLQMPQPLPQTFFQRLFGRQSFDTARYELEYEQTFMALVIAALLALGVNRAYCRYDGGGDEGFAWIDHVELSDGRQLNAATLAEQLVDGGLMERFYALGFLDRRIGGPEIDEGDISQMLDMLRDGLTHEWAQLLLGKHYGTGEVWMYGAFKVDLKACTIVDDRNAAPIVENIQIAKDAT
jgi:hypothetical protein